MADQGGMEYVLHDRPPIHLSGVSVAKSIVSHFYNACIWVPKDAWPLVVNVKSSSEEDL